jgi:hypothetical protein
VKEREEADEPLSLCVIKLLPKISSDLILFKQEDLMTHHEGWRRSERDGCFFIIFHLGSSMKFIDTDDYCC